MATDTRGLGQEHVGKRLWLELAGGELDEIKLLDVTVCEPAEPCCGIMYTLLSTNRSDGSKEPGATYWTAFRDIEKFRVLGD